jgi:ABC-type polysaccharide/polyol phosphate transport system ATPase subunit
MSSFSTHADAQHAAAPVARARPVPAEAPVVIEVRDLRKTFRIPEERIDSLKERATHPFAHRDTRELRALRGVSFDVHRGEFFGIVGRNGSGKSSLLKILASIYRADAGRIRVAGRLAPFIELGVGFNPELTARENVVLNGVMMGASRREAGRRLDAVMDFAELGDFLDLKLKNYSSGMMVRLAFAAMVQADADVMLVDEVLAVGDAAFAQKCMDVFHAKRRAGKTIVLVTHDMGTVQGLCDRAMLLHEGQLRHVGDPREVALHYLRLNFAPEQGVDAVAEGEPPPDVLGEDAVPDLQASLVDAHLKTEAGERTGHVEQERPFTLDVVLRAERELTGPVFAIHVFDADNTLVFGMHKVLAVQPGQPDRLLPGQRVRLAGRIENQLLPGRYSMQCWISRKRQQGLAMQALPLLEFVVFGTRAALGFITPIEDVSAVPEPPEPTDG